VVTAEALVPRDPIRFELNTANVLPESRPTLDAMVQLLADHPEIALVAIEGHASEEGTYEHNYALVDGARVGHLRGAGGRRHPSGSPGAAALGRAQAARDRRRGRRPSC
jgi:hypothetical protein